MDTNKTYTIQINFFMLNQLTILILATFFPKVLKGKAFNLFGHKYLIGNKIGKLFTLTGEDVQNPKRISVKDLVFVTTKYESKKINDLRRLTKIYNHINIVDGYKALLSGNFISGGAYLDYRTEKPRLVTSGPQVVYNSATSMGCIEFYNSPEVGNIPMSNIVRLVKEDNVHLIWSATAKMQLSKFLTEKMGMNIDVRVNKSDQAIATGKGMFFMIKPEDIKLASHTVNFILGYINPANGKYGYYYRNGFKERVYIGKPQENMTVYDFLTANWSEVEHMMSNKAQSFNLSVKSLCNY